MQQEGVHEYEEYDSEEYIEEEGEYSAGEEHDGQVADLGSDADGQEIDGEIADVDEEEEEEEEDEEDGAGGAGGGGGGGGGQQQQMLYIPGLGYFPLSSLGNVPGLGNLAARGGPAAAPQLEGEKEWAALAQFPEETKSSLYELLNQLKEDGRDELTVLLLGKGGVGKSSTVNSLLNERAATVMAFQQDAPRTATFSRRAAGFTLHLIDTPSMLEQDNVSDKRLEDVAKAVKGRAVDAVLYLDRLDQYKVGPLDKRVLSAITRVLGPSIWTKAIICFTRASESAAPPGVAFEDFVDERAQQLRAAIEQAGGWDAELPVALVENSSRCPINEAGEKVTPNGEAWIVDLMRQVKDVALDFAPYRYNAKAAAKASNPDRRRKWLIPLVLLAQVAIKLLLDRVLDEDGVRGDANGPFDEETVKERREDLRREKEERKRKAEREKALRSRAADEELRSVPLYDDFDAEEEEEEDDY